MSGAGRANRLGAAVLLGLPRARDAVSFAHAAESSGRMMLLKFALYASRRDLIYLPAAVALHVRSAVRDAIARCQYEDVRSKHGPARVHPAIADFQRLRPVFDAGDFDLGPEGRGSRLALGCEVHAFPTGVYLGFRLEADIFKVVKIEPKLTHYVPEMIDEIEAAGLLAGSPQTTSAGYRH